MSPALPPPELIVSKQQARRFLLAHHRLLPPRRLQGKQGVLDYVRHVNCIQYDPINVVGNNSHLVLQSRVRGYKREMLNELLYADRALMDGMDKVMSIFPIEDWPYFAHHRAILPPLWGNYGPAKDAFKLVPWVRDQIKERGPLCSTDLEEDTRMTWWLSGSARAARISLDILFEGGEIMVHHKVGTRRYFDLVERVLPKRIVSQPTPHTSPEAYQDWHVLRRVGGLGLAHPRRGGQQWVGIMGKTSARASSVDLGAADRRLLEDGKLVRLGVEGLPKEEFYLRRSDLPVLEAAARKPKGKPGAAFLAALDNFMWDRDLIDMLFDFYYRWEVYVPAPKRKWGYYVLPVLYGDQLVARFDPSFDKLGGVLTIKNWWWQPGVDKKDDAMLTALQDCVQAFCKYLGANEVKLGSSVNRDRFLKKMIS